VKDILTPFRYVTFMQYAENTALVATSRKSSLLVGCLEAYFSKVELCLWYWSISGNVSKYTAVLFLRL
jgi:hypothetical protein